MFRCFLTVKITMECKGYFAIMKMITVLILWIPTTRGCNEQGVRVCLIEFGLPNDQGIYTCNSDSFETCLDKNAYSDEQCTSQGLVQAVESVRQLQASTDCVRGGVPYHDCMKGEPLCASELIESVTLLTSASVESPSFSLIHEAVCFCEDKSSWVDELIHKLQQCLDREGYADCPVNVKAKYQELLNSQKLQIQTIVTNENACSQLRAYTPTSCECTREVDKCTNTYLGSDFREKQTMIDPTKYPACLKFGTEEKFKAATGCLLRLPSECGQQNYTNFITSQADSPIYFPGYFVFTLRYGCAAACANKQVTAHSAFGCLVPHGLGNWTAEEIKALQGQKKDEFCRKVETATKCAAEKFAACPRYLVAVIKAIQEYKTGKLVTENTQGIPDIILEMFEACDTDLLKYTNLLLEDDRSTGKRKGSTAANKAVQKLVSVISIFMLFLVQLCVM